MKLAVDVGYRDDVAFGVGLVFCSWQSEEVYSAVNCQMAIVKDYIPGKFYLRELPCILALIEKAGLTFECIVVDGYVALGEDAQPGLGMKLWDALDGKTPVIGVAKTYFHGTPYETELLRGQSNTPLYVTAAGMTLTDAKSHIASMAGPFRIPTLLRLVDQATRHRQ